MLYDWISLGSMKAAAQERGENADLVEGEASPPRETTQTFSQAIIHASVNKDALAKQEALLLQQQQAQLQKQEQQLAAAQAAAAAKKGNKATNLLKAAMKSKQKD